MNSRYSMIAATADASTRGPHTVIVASALCIAVMAISGCASNRSTNSPRGGENVDANRQPLTLEQISHLDQQAFEHSLPQLCQVIQQTSPAAGTDQETLTTIQEKLRQAGETTPKYWSTVMWFLQFASSSIALKAPPSGQQAKLLSDILSVGIMRGVREYDKTILFDGGSLGNGDFTNCRIIFSQHDVEMQNVVFRVCAFEFPAAVAPNGYLKKLCRTLLTSDLTSVSIAIFRTESQGR